MVENKGVCVCVCVCLCVYMCKYVYAVSVAFELIHEGWEEVQTQKPGGATFYAENKSTIKALKWTRYGELGD
jgi:hypothetical protein